MFVKLTKEANALLRWLSKAATKGRDAASRASLSGVHVNGNVMVATDGYRLHATKTPQDLAEFDGKIVAFDKIPANATVVEAEEVESTFLDYASVLPKTKPMFEIAVNAGYLTEALKGITRHSKEVTLRFWEVPEGRWGVPYEVCGETGAGEPIYALIMPMARGNEKLWQPKAQNEVAPTADSKEDTDL